MIFLNKLFYHHRYVGFDMRPVQSQRPDDKVVEDVRCPHVSADQTVTGQHHLVITATIGLSPDCTLVLILSVTELMSE